MNPITEFRLGHRMTQAQLAEKARVHPQAVFLNEQGVYIDILPSILKIMLANGADRKDVCHDYLEYQKEKRRLHGEINVLDLWNLDKLGPPVGNPLRQFREQLGMSRLGFCKSFCLHPAQELSAEMGHTTGLGYQTHEALLQAGLSPDIVNEIEIRLQERYDER